jgi:hypothetical protein
MLHSLTKIFFLVIRSEAMVVTPNKNPRIMEETATRTLKPRCMSELTAYPGTATMIGDNRVSMTVPVTIEDENGRMTGAE